jgi:hypothetical protein
MNSGSTPAFSSPSSESHPGSAGTDAELQAALEAAQTAEAHVLELMHAKDAGAILGAALEIALPYGISEPSETRIDAPTEAPAAIGETRIEIFRPMDRDALVISAGDHRVMVPMRVIRERLKAEGADLMALTTGDLLDIAPYILEHPEEFEAIGEYTIASAPSAEVAE